MNTVTSPAAETRVTHRTLQAAWYVSKRAPAKGCTKPTLKTQLSRIATGGIHDQTSLEGGLDLLFDVGLFEQDDKLLIPTAELLHLRQMPLDTFVEVLLMRRLTVRPDLWLTMFTEMGNLPWDFLPSDIRDVLASTHPDEDERAAFLINAVSKVDQLALTAYGDMGEQTVVTACQTYLRDKGRPDLASSVVQVSLTDDTLGYDIASPDTKGRRHRLEVKATSAPPGWVEFYLSRNEATVAARSAHWSVVVCKRDIVGRGDLDMRVVGWLRHQDFAHLLPSDTTTAGLGESGVWASARIKLAEEALAPGLPLDG